MASNEEKAEEETSQVKSDEITDISEMPDNVQDENVQEQSVQVEEEDDDEANEVLEAATIFVLMSKQFRLSRNARAKW